MSIKFKKNSEHVKESLIKSSSKKCGISSYLLLFNSLPSLEEKKFKQVVRVLVSYDTQY